MRHKIITFILAVVVIIIIGNMIGGGGGSEATSKTSSGSKAETEKTYNIGDTVKTEKLK